MLKPINDLPPQVAGLHAFAEVTETEYEQALVSLLEDLLNKNNRINFILVLETDIHNFSPGCWCGSIKIGFKYFFKWKKVATVSDQKGVMGCSDLFKYILPGKFKTFPLDQLDEAMRWVSKR
ncbi:STAS/SEC14 domain-containing protein [Mucilaginibacter sp.]|uniref:STAS/SEC14 domain-containing protein n=1 Tax=Mucilaginibacter sp. TaxID=1882438 RepID=UPI003D11907D